MTSLISTALLAGCLLGGFVANAQTTTPAPSASVITVGFSEADLDQGEVSSGVWSFKIVLNNVTAQEIAARPNGLFEGISLFIPNTVGPLEKIESDPNGFGLYVLQDNSNAQTEVPNPTGTLFTVTIPIIVYEIASSGKLAELTADTQSVTIKATYLEAGATQPRESDPLTVSVVKIAVDDVPTSFSTSGSHKTVALSYTTASSVTQKGSSTSGSPSSVVQVLIPSTSAATSISGAIFNSDSNVDDTPVTCSIAPPASGSTTCIDATACTKDPAEAVTADEAANIYFSTADLQAMVQSNTELAYKTTTAPSGGGTVTSSFTNLTNGATYYAFIFYQPNGLQRSSCLSATPQVDYTLTEWYGENEGIVTNEHCFIATATYGTAQHNHLDQLRWVRDHLLKKNSLGNAFVEMYYLHSPPYADYIKERPYLQWIMRVILWPIVAVAATLHWIADHLVVFYSVLALLVGLFLATKIRGRLYS